MLKEEHLAHFDKYQYKELPLVLMMDVNEELVDNEVRQSLYTNDRSVVEFMNLSNMVNLREISRLEKLYR